MHAIWLSIIATPMVMAVWVWPNLRNPQLWLGISLFALVAGAIWLGRDLNSFAAARGTWKDAAARAIYLLVSETGKPIVQVVVGSGLASLIAWCLPNRVLCKNGDSSLSAINEPT